MLKEAFPAGTLKVIYGPMHSGKSAELLRLLDRVKFTSKQVKVFQPKIDTRSNGISSKFIPDRIYETILIDHPLDIFKLELNFHWFTLLNIPKVMLLWAKPLDYRISLYKKWGE